MLLESEEIQKEAEERVEAEQYIFNTDWQKELKYIAEQKAQSSGWRWADEGPGDC